MTRPHTISRIIGLEIIQILNTVVFCSFLLLLFAISVHAQQDFKGSSDHPLFPNRMPGFAISYYQQLGYGSFNFNGRPPQKIEGKYTKISYLIKKDAPNPGDLAIRRNYENAVKASDGEVVFADDYYSVMKIMRNGKEVWAEVITRSGGPQYALNIIECEEIRRSSQRARWETRLIAMDSLPSISTSPPARRRCFPSQSRWWIRSSL
jgi:hypothetical protein